ncbi:MAG: hypothetical protein WKF36_10180 [Candidatus Nitrosocosmicus sp.]
MSDNLPIRPHTIPIVENISFPTNIQILGNMENTMSNSASTSIFKNSDFTVDVLEPLSISERLVDFYDSRISPIGGIWTFLVGISHFCRLYIIFNLEPNPHGCM